MKGIFLRRPEDRSDKGDRDSDPGAWIGRYAKQWEQCIRQCQKKHHEIHQHDL